MLIIIHYIEELLFWWLQGVFRDIVYWTDSNTMLMSRIRLTRTWLVYNMQVLDTRNQDGVQSVQSGRPFITANIRFITYITYIITF